MSSIASTYKEAIHGRRIASLVLSIATIVMSLGILAMFIAQPAIFLSMGTLGLSPAEAALIDSLASLPLLPIAALALLIRMPKRDAAGASVRTAPLTFGIVAACLCAACFLYPQALMLMSAVFFLVGVLTSTPV
ncbi:hypothetical protein OED01_03600 [Microbacterium sp. M28]|uniref:hypothetical protein n=1 Tax=Microbacterium sp. M28 TaxID=2962064 RepID=UPI0021F4B0A7|nr:hypothetical protein [Microbacterium sp. M28]UYO97816.1 hypothetical protein OED01_03600 [Microbacterium sp. M28]